MLNRDNAPTWLCVVIAAFQLVEQNAWRRQDLKQPSINLNEYQFWIGNGLLICSLLFAVFWSNRKRRFEAPPENDLHRQLTNETAWKMAAHKELELLRPQLKEKDGRISELTNERDAARQERDSAYSAEVDRHNAIKKQLVDASRKSVVL